MTSLARPGGNLTGMSTQQPDLASKRVELLREVIPNLRRLAIMGNVGYPSAVLDMDEAQVAARTLGLEVARMEIRRTQDIAHAFDEVLGRVQALDISGDPLISVNRARINSFAIGAHLPTMYGSREYVDDGGLIAYGPSFPVLFRRAAENGRQNSARDEANRNPGGAADQI